jgi:hypothetical protein
MIGSITRMVRAIGTRATNGSGLADIGIIIITGFVGIISAMANSIANAPVSTTTITTTMVTTITIVTR